MADIRETESKNKLGGKIYIADLEKIVYESYPGLKLPQGSSEYVCMCPICKEIKGSRYTNKKLYVTKDLMTSYCFVCNSTLLDLNSMPEKKEVNNEISNLFEFDISNNDIHFPKIDFSIIDNMKKVIDSEEGLDYIIKRNKYIDPEKYNLKYSKNKIVIPFYLNNKTMFYQIRYMIPPRPDMKYWTLDQGHKPFYIVSGKFDINKPTIITEGVFTGIAVDCLKLDVNVISILGKYLTEFQNHLLSYTGIKNSPLYILLDETQLSYNLKVHLRNSYGLESHVIPSDGRDAEEMINETGYESYSNYIKNNLNRHNISRVFDKKNNKDYKIKDLDISIDEIFYSKFLS